MTNKGIELERRLNMLFWNYGYFVRRNIKMLLKRGIEITDLDVFAIKFDEFLRPMKISVECKHLEGGFDSILKLRGIADYYSIDVPIIVRRKIDSVTHDFINKLNMIGITHSHLDDLEKYFGIENDKDIFFELYNLEEVDKTKSNIKNKLNMISGIKDILWRIDESWMIVDPFERYVFHRIIYSTLKNQIEQKIDDESKNGLKLFLFENHILAAMSCIEMASVLIERPKHQRKDKLVVNLLGGEISIKEKRKLANLVKEIIKVSGVPIDEKMFKLEPEYIVPLNSLIGEMVRNPYLCQKYLRLLDYVTYNYICFNQKIDVSAVVKSIKISKSTIQSFSKWNELLIKSLDDEEKISKYLVDLI